MSYPMGMDSHWHAMRCLRQDRACFSGGETATRRRANLARFARQQVGAGPPGQRMPGLTGDRIDKGRLIRQLVPSSSIKKASARHSQPVERSEP